MEPNTLTTSTVEDIMSLFGHAAPGSINPQHLFSALAEATAEEIRTLRKFALGKGVAAKDYDKAARAWRMQQELGCVPATSQDFVDAYATSIGVEADYNGVLSRTKSVGPFATDYTIADLERDAFLANERLRAGFDHTLIRAAIQAWIAAARPLRQAEIWATINDPYAPPAEEEWQKFARALVDTSRVSLDYAIAVNRKFMWQIKRKMLGLPVTDHLMPVFCGDQGNGKTTAILKMLAVIAGADRKVSFGEITDVRNVDMWRSFALFADEMERAQKADIEAVKGVITAEMLDRRVLGTSNMVRIRQNGTLIGATNGSLGGNIRDTSGLRRFAPIPTLGRPGRSDHPVDWNAINGTDFAALWRSVQVDDPDPMIPYVTELDSLQEAERERGPVELWLESLSSHSHRAWREAAENGIRAEDLFRMYADYESDYIRSPVKLSLQTWGREMTAYLAKAEDRSKFRRKRVSEGVRYYPTSMLLIDDAVTALLRAA